MSRTLSDRIWEPNTRTGKGGHLAPYEHPHGSFARDYVQILGPVTFGPDGYREEMITLIRKVYVDRHETFRVCVWATEDEHKSEAKTAAFRLLAETLEERY